MVSDNPSCDSALPPGSVFSGCQTPVLLLIQRRPEQTARVLSAIRQARPAQLLVAADGPEEDGGCAQTRRLVLEGIDWPCEVETRFSKTKLGCKRAVSSALDWAFGRHEELIILEDDCVPNPSFFLFCDEMLGRYRHSSQVMQICGSNLLGLQQGQQSYYFSRFGPIWGWASWRRAWQVYEVDLKMWPEVLQSGKLRQLCPEPFEAGWRREVLDEVHQGRVDTWDYQWAFAKLARGGLNIIPACNLISNVGFGPQATHTRNADDPRAGLPTQELQPPWGHPDDVSAWREADQQYLSQVVGLPKTPWSYAGLRRWVRMLLRR